MAFSYDHASLWLNATYRVDDSKDVGIHLHVEVVLELGVRLLGGGEISVEVVSLVGGQICAVDEEVVELVGREFADFRCSGLE